MTLRRFKIHLAYCWNNTHYHVTLENQSFLQNNAMWLMEQKVIKKEFFRGKSHGMKCNVQQTSSDAKKAGIINESKFTSG